MIHHLKLSAITLALIASSMAHADDVSIYGTVDAGLRASTNQMTPGSTLAQPNRATRYSLISGGLTSSLIGFKGVEDLGGGNRAIFQLESGLNLAIGTNDSVGILFNRTSHVGLTDGRHTVLVGRDYNEAYMSLSEVDPLNFRLPLQNPNMIFGALDDIYTYGVQVAGQTDSRVSNAVTYEGKYDALKAGLQYSTGSLAGTSARNTYGTRASYDFGPGLVSGSASRFNDVNNAHLNVYTIGGKYRYTPELTLAATYVNQKVYGGALDGNSRRISSVGAYYTPSIMTYGVAYYASSAQNKLVGLASYGLSKRTNLYSTADYARNKNALVLFNTNPGNVFGLTVGLNHSF